ncbi:MAG: Holliday junction branch migration protein RuvA [Gemmatimonadetes bacterium]|nr:Holliday junction branch migration protein RuvA [Gemmatimonadota bacterium]
MISRLRGTLLRRDLGVAEVMTAAGIGYEVEIPLTVFERLPREGAEVELRIYHAFREDGQALYGFLAEAERAVFARLLTASGVGPRLALAMLSHMTPERLVRAITERDIAALKQVPGLGAKKAERLALELGDKLGDLAFAAAGPRPEGRAAEEAVAALVALGYSPAEATTAVRRALDERGPMGGVDLIKAALASMVR